MILGITASQRNKFVGLLDDYPNAAAAYSLRKLRTAYTGSAIRVRRSNDNAEQDIGFDGSGNLDTSSLSTFVGANNGFVTIWYDQSGNTQHATQSIAANQPKIYDSTNGVLLDNSLPCIDTIGFRNLDLPNATYLNNKSQFYIIGVMKALTNTSSVPNVYASFTSSNNSKVALLFDFTTANRYQVGGRRTGVDSFQSVVDSTDATNIQSLIIGHLDYDNGAASIYRNASAGVVNNSFYTGQMDSSSTTGLDDTIAGNYNNPLQRFDAYYQELIVYNTDQSANRSGIETNVNDYYAIY